MYQVIGEQSTNRRIIARVIVSDVTTVARSARFARCSVVTILDWRGAVIAHRGPGTGQAWVK